MIKKLVLVFLVFLTSGAFAQTTGSITVGGDLDKFYPVTFLDDGWHLNLPSEVEIGRSNVHLNSPSRGSLISKFRYHITNYGHGSNFITADIIQHPNVAYPDGQFIAGWQDVSMRSASYSIAIWLRGGGTTYYYKSLHPITITVYDGVANPLPFQELNGPAHTFKTGIDSYVNSYGITHESAYFNADKNNYFAGTVGIGTTDPKGYKLAVNGKIRAQEIKVEASPWPDYVFGKDYQLPTLQQTEQHIKEKGHLPGIPSAAEVKANGIDLGEMNAKLLRKIEELTLHLIEQNKKFEMKILTQQKEIDQLKSKR